MKKMILLSLALVLMLGGVSCNAQDSKKQVVNSVATAKIEVYYFHFTRRCMTCNAVETETRKAIEMMYPALFKKGMISFKSINLDEANNQAVAKKCAVEGQSLLVMSGTKRIDMTSQGFMYAVNNPEKLKAELKKAIDPLL